MPVLTPARIELPLMGMEVGDSFFVPSYDTTATIRMIQREARICSVFVKSIVVLYEGVLGVRVWRVR